MFSDDIRYGIRRKGIHLRTIDKDTPVHPIHTNVTNGAILDNVKLTEDYTGLFGFTESASGFLIYVHWFETPIDGYVGFMVKLDRHLQ